jgi:hypothetical protein
VLVVRVVILEPRDVILVEFAAKVISSAVLDANNDVIFVEFAAIFASSVVLEVCSDVTLVFKLVISPE